MSNKNYKSTGWFKPYKGKRDQSLKVTGKGVYYIRLSGIIVYIGKSLTDVKGTLYRHFQQWTDKRHPENKKAQIYARVTYAGMNVDKFECKVIFVSSAKEVDNLEQYLILKHKPRDNAQKFDFLTEGQKMKLADKLMDAALFGDRVKIDDSNEVPF